MKQIYLYLACLLLSLAVHAEKSPRTIREISKVGNVQFKFNNLAPANAHKDSILIIFDRFNHTGAGVIYQVYYVDNSGNITIEGVPAGKYYVTIRGLGLHRDRTEAIVKVKSRKNKKMMISLQDSEEFSKDKVVIPAYRPNFADMAVLKMK